MKRFDPSRPVYRPATVHWIRWSTVGHSFRIELEVGQGECSPEIRLTKPGYDALDGLSAAATGDGQRGEGAKRKQRTRKRGKAKELTRPQEAVVAALEDFKVSVADVAKQRGCTDKAIYAILKRAKENPGYKDRRSVNLHTAEPLHANTLPKSDARDDE
jgi:hypothetical protein